MHSVVRIFIFVGVGLALMGCGTAKKASKTVTTPTTTPTPTNNDATSALPTGAPAYNVMGFNAIEDAVDAIADDGSNLSLSLAVGGTDATRTRVCAAGASNDVITTVTLSGASAQTIIKPKVTLVANMTWGGHETRDWTPPLGQTLACNSDGTKLNLNWLNSSLVNHLYVAVGVDKSRTVSKTITSNNKTVTASDNVKTNGSRTIRWVAGATTTTKTIAEDVSITRTTVDVNGVTTNFVATVKTDENAPLSVAVARNTISGSLISKTIVSGTQISTMADGSSLHTKFSNVKFDLSSTADNKCQPISGTVSGSIFAAGATTPTTSFVIMFGDTSVDSGISITYSSAGSLDYPEYTAKGCDLEKDS